MRRFGVCLIIIVWILIIIFGLVFGGFCIYAGHPLLGIPVILFDLFLIGMTLIALDEL